MSELNFTFTKNQLAMILIGNRQVDQWYTACLNSFPKFDINTKGRVSHFLAQTTHESNSFTVLKENLNYSSEGLRKVFGKYFATDAIAQQYARKPEAIANRVYANRMGNGPESSGDGWKFRGKGLIQLTGKNNHIAYAEATGQNLDQALEKLLTPDGALESACWFWSINNLNGLADSDDIVSITKRINGGTIGLDDRKLRYQNIIKILG